MFFEPTVHLSSYTIPLSLVGQTPRKLFTSPHPERHHHGAHTLPIGTLHGVEEDPHLLTQNSRCFKGELYPTPS